MDNLGAIGGPLVALALVAMFWVRTTILLSIIPGLLAAVAIIYAIRHLPQAGEAKSVNRSGSASDRSCKGTSAGYGRSGSV